MEIVFRPNMDWIQLRVCEDSCSELNSKLVLNIKFSILYLTLNEEDFLEKLQGNLTGSFDKKFFTILILKIIFYFFDIILAYILLKPSMSLLSC